MKTKTQVKEVGYAYPSSEIAERLSKGKTGGWIVRTFDDALLIAPIEIDGPIYDTKEEAFAAADAIRL